MFHFVICEIFTIFKRFEISRHFIKNLSMNSTPRLSWLRWIGVLPCSVIAYFIAYNLIRLFNWIETIIGIDKDDVWWFNNFTGPALATGVAGYAFVKAGVSLAPTHKKDASLILLILLALLSGIGIFVSIINKRYMPGILECVAQLIGTVIAFKEIEKE